MSESACLRRVRQLEERGIIERFTMIINQAAVGMPGNVLAEITLSSQVLETLDTFEEALRAGIGK